MSDLDTVLFDIAKSIARPRGLAYCDYIAHRIATDLKRPDPERIIAKCETPQWDLDPNGAFVSTKKTIIVDDVSGKQYRVTVEEVKP